jgi:hypothetical protein
LEAAEEIEEEYPGAGVTWRDVLDPTKDAIPQPSASAATPQAEQDGEPIDEPTAPEQDDQGAEDDDES